MTCTRRSIKKQGIKKVHQIGETLTLVILFQWRVEIKYLTRGGDKVSLLFNEQRRKTSPLLSDWKNEKLAQNSLRKRASKDADLNYGCFFLGGDLWFGLVSWVLWHINRCRLFNASLMVKIFLFQTIQAVICSNSVRCKYSFNVEK